jgi:hypothetical protein
VRLQQPVDDHWTKARDNECVDHVPAVCVDRRKGFHRPHGLGSGYWFVYIAVSAPLL